MLWVHDVGTAPRRMQKPGARISSAHISARANPSVSLDVSALVTFPCSGGPSSARWAGFEKRRALTVACTVACGARALAHARLPAFSRPAIRGMLPAAADFVRWTRRCGQTSTAPWVGRWPVGLAGLARAGQHAWPGSGTPLVGHGRRRRSSFGAETSTSKWTH